MSALLNRITVESSVAPNDRVLAVYEAQHERLMSELLNVEQALRHLRLLPQICRHCCGVGIREIRSGLYGEVITLPCRCQSSEEGT